MVSVNHLAEKHPPYLTCLNHKDLKQTQRMIAIRCLSKKHGYKRDLLIRLPQWTTQRWKGVEN